MESTLELWPSGHQVENRGWQCRVLQALFLCLCLCRCFCPCLCHCLCICVLLWLFNSRHFFCVFVFVVVIVFAVVFVYIFVSSYDYLIAAQPPCLGLGCTSEDDCRTSTLPRCTGAPPAKPNPMWMSNDHVYILYPDWHVYVPLSVHSRTEPCHHIFHCNKHTPDSTLLFCFSRWLF